MNTQPCLPQELTEVNKSKEYTLISTHLLESVLTDTRLNAQTTKLWQILFNYARFNPDFAVKISYACLAKKLGKSARTISRYVELLQDTGYLIVKHNFDNKGGQRPSTLSVRVPENTIEHTKKKKDRHNKNNFNNNGTSITEDSGADLIDAEEPLLFSNDLHVPCRTNQRNAHMERTNQSLPSNAADRSQSHEKDWGLTSSTPEVKNGRGSHDINVLHKDNNKNKDIYKNNNNTVVPFLQNKERTASLQQEIKLLEQQLAEGNKQLTHIKDHSQLYDQIKKNSRIEAALHLSRIALEKMYRALEENTKQQKSALDLTTNPVFMLNKVGERILPIFTFKRLVHSLKGYGYNGNTLNVMINEIVFEARFGTLTKCSKTKKPISLDNAINIGLKLVREKRWGTPGLLKT